MSATKRTTKKERRGAKLDAIQWNGLAKWSKRNGQPMMFNHPEPGTSIGQWARLKREGEVQLSVKINVRVEYK